MFSVVWKLLEMLWKYPENKTSILWKRSVQFSRCLSLMSSFLCAVGGFNRFRRVLPRCDAKKIGGNFARSERNEYTRLQVSL